MAEKISGYTADGTSDPIKLTDLLDFSNYDGVSAYDVSKKILVSELLTFLGTTTLADNIYNINGTLGGDRTVDGASLYDLIFDNIDNIEINADTSLELTSGGAFSLIVANNVDIVCGLDIALAPTGFITGGTLALAPAGNILMSMEGGINTEDAFYIDNLEILSRQGMGTGGLSLGNNTLTSAAASSRNTGLGDGALLSTTTGVRNVASGNDCFWKLTGASSYNAGSGKDVGNNMVLGSYNAIFGGLGGSLIVEGQNLTMLGGRTGAAVSGNYSDSIALGNLAKINASNQWVTGSNDSYIEEVYFGAGIEDTSITPTELNMRITNIVAGETDVTPAFDWVWNGSQGTGTGVGSDHIWKVAPAGTTGSAVNTLVTAMTVQAINAAVKFDNAPILPEFTVAGVPTASEFDNGVIIVSDETGGRTIATSDGTDWRRVSDGAIIS